MNFSNYKFTLDMHTAQSQVSLPVVLNDTARKFYISLSDGGKSYHIADGCLALVRINRPTGTYVEHFCSIEDNTNIVYDLSQFENTAIIPGVHDCEVTLYGLDDKVITTARFTMVVSERVVNSDDIEIKDENWTMLDEIGNEEARRQAAESARNKAETLRDDAEKERVKAEFERETNTAIVIEAANAVAAELLRKAEDGEFNGKDGKDGKDGEDGYTPVKGVDYFDGKDGKNGDVGPVGPVGPAGVHVGTEAPTDGQTVWIDTDEEPEEEPEESGTKIDVIANVGQVIAVKAVGADSKPTEFEAVDLPKVTPPDFSANEGEEGYIKNRTHYIDENGIVHKLSNKYIDADWMATSEDFIDPSIIIPEQKVTSTWSNRQMDIQPGIIYDVHINGVVYPCEALNKSGGIILGNNTAMTLNDYPFCIFWAGGTATGGMFFHNNTLESPIYMKVTGHSYTVYNKLPEEFLPECVVKTVNGSKPDEKGNVTVEIPEGGGGIPYIVGNSTTAGTWTGECAEITEYYEGLTVLYKLNVAGVSGGTTLDINGLGAATVYCNASTAIRTTYPIGSVVMLTYSEGKWLTADANVDTRNTAGTAATSNVKLFVVGSRSQNANGVTTNTNSGVYIGTDNELYSNGKKVATEEDIPSGGGSGINVTAEVGQTIVVEEVDGNGKPTKWKAAEYQPRTHWSEPVEVLPETTCEVIEDIGAAMLPDMAISAGDTLTVVFNGTEYICECADVDGSLAFGNYGVMDEENPVDTGEPFAAVKVDSGDGTLIWACVPLDGSATFTLSVMGEVHHTVPEKYLPHRVVDVIFTVTCTEAGKEVITPNISYSEAKALAKTPNTEMRGVMKYDTACRYYVLHVMREASNDILGEVVFASYNILSSEVSFDYIIMLSDGSIRHEGVNVDIK